MIMIDSTTTGTGIAGQDADETQRLISSSKVEGTNVYNPEGEHVGSVDCFMVDKFSGKVAYAVMSFGGFLGIGERYHPLPWAGISPTSRASSLKAARHLHATKNPGSNPNMAAGFTVITGCPTACKLFGGGGVQKVPPLLLGNFLLLGPSRRRRGA
jgi:hypothetical protein